MTNLLYLIFSHYLTDFGLQSDWSAKNKSPYAGSWWVHVMLAHCSMQALTVLIVTQNPYLAIGELVAHFCIDYCKCIGKLGFTADQVLHILFRLLWWFLM